MADRRETLPWWMGWLDPKNWYVAALTAFMCLITWTLANQISPPVIEACQAKVVAPPFDRNAKP